MTDTLEALKAAGVENRRAGGIAGYAALALVLSFLAPIAVVQEWISFGETVNTAVAYGVPGGAAAVFVAALGNLMRKGRAVTVAADEHEKQNPGFAFGHL
ncbi:MAG: hypothetical protein AAB955_00535 [Patescibacteria group bacterium]